jgi:cell division protein FtsQ
VVVTGTTFTDPAAVVDATGVERGDPLVWVDVDAVDARVEALPWVAEARVSRDWRGRLRVGVTEQVPAAWVRGPDDEVVVVAGDGRVLGPAPAPFPDLVEIRGVRRVPPPGDRLSPDGVAGLASTLPPALVDDLVAVDVGGTGVTAVLGDGPELRLGSLDEIATKGAVAEAVLARLVERGIAADFVDVSVPSAPVAGTDAAGALPGLDAPAGEGGA